MKRFNILNILTLFLFTMTCETAFTQEWSMKTAPLMTRWASQVDTNMPLPEYPRPQMVREEWKNLNGIWQFQPGAESDAVPFNTNLSSKILVPFPVESAISGVMQHYSRIWYRKLFTVPSEWSGKRILLHFGAIDWESEIYVNGTSMGIHKGGYNEITLDITEYLTGDGEQELIVRVFDPTKTYGQPRGKQTTEPAGIMYTSTTGIWQTVWLEPVDDNSISSLTLIPDIDNKRLKITVNTSSGLPLTVSASAFDGDVPVGSVTGNANTGLYLNIENPKLWSPESPFLYNLNVVMKNGDVVTDSVTGYFGMRKIEVRKVGNYPMIFLNNKYTFNMGPLDQGFWPDGIYTAPTDEALRYDLEIIKALGFNMVRKHIKVEPHRWYYWADKLGIMVWQDMPSANSYDPPNPYPTVDKPQFKTELTRMVENHISCPSIIMWVIFNEYQGQHDEAQLVDHVRDLDNSRLISVGSGSSGDYLGDIRDHHAYPPPVVLPSYTRAAVCGEFGGISLPIEGHLWNGDHTFYDRVANGRELTERYELYGNMLMEFKTFEKASGGVYTEITDVEIEMNGFMTYDRELKIDTSDIRRINENIINEWAVERFNLIDPADKSKTIWKYTFSKPSADWFNIAFDDSQWKLGKGIFTADRENNNFGTFWSTSEIWLRKEFFVGSLSQDDYNRLVYKLRHDDRAIIYINGAKVDEFGGWNNNYEIIPLSQAAKDALIQNSMNTIAVYCKQDAGGQFIDLGLLRTTTFSFDTTCAINLLPENLSFDIQPANTTLSWKPGQFANEHKVYLDTIPQLTGASFVGSITDSIYIANNLLKDKTYYWRVDAVSDKGTLTGATWQFTTGPQPVSSGLPVSLAPQSLSVSPNPAGLNSLLAIDGGNNQNISSVEVWSVDGKLVFCRYGIDKTNLQLSLSSDRFKAGMYFLKVQSGNVCFPPLKLIVQ
ncbi:MAG: T9SS type A sorting domain-containing protein [Bacteroidales bacterium]|nr:T9SS type A sorting domain-containing protein [Bacteroidales bacterium]